MFTFSNACYKRIKILDKLLADNQLVSIFLQFGSIRTSRPMSYFSFGVNELCIYFYIFRRHAGNEARASEGEPLSMCSACVIVGWLNSKTELLQMNRNSSWKHTLGFCMPHENVDVFYCAYVVLLRLLGRVTKLSKDLM